MGRSRQGSAIAEFGPALFVLFICLLFPLLDLATLGLQYFSCKTLNDLQTQKASEVARSAAIDPAGLVQHTIPTNWQSTGVGAFTKLSHPPTTQVDYPTADGQNSYVVVSTTFSVDPLLTMPFFPGIPALGAPAVFTIKSQRLLEDPSNLNR